MKRAILAALLVSRVALGQESLPTDAPVAVYVKDGLATVSNDEAGPFVTVQLPPGLYFNTAGQKKLDEVVMKFQATIHAQSQHIANVEAQNTELRKGLDEVAATPPMVSPAAVLGIGLGILVVGAAAGYAGAKLLR